MLNGQTDLKRVRADNAARDIVSLTFGILGICFMLTGGGFLIFSSSEPAVSGDAAVFPLLGGIFLIIGILLVITTAILLVVSSRRTQFLKEIVAEGNYVMAAPVRIDFNRHLQVNQRYAQYLYCRYTDEYGTIHEFRSRSFFSDPAVLLSETEIPVYLRRGDYSHYYVDIDSILSNTNNESIVTHY